MPCRTASYALTCLTCLWLAGCGTKGSVRAEDDHTAPAPPVVSVEVETLEPQIIAFRIPIVGTLHAAEEAVISTKTAGILRRTFVDVGHTVRPGDPLAQVDTLDYEIAVTQTQASLAEALARLGVNEVPGEGFDLLSVSSVERTAAQVANARFTYERLLKISGDIANVAEQELNDAATRLRVAEADHRLALDSAAALVASARERQSLLRMSQQRLAHTTTRTPPIPTTLGQEGATEWVVAERLVTEGQYLNVADELYRLIINNPLKLRSRIPERYALEVRVGQQVGLEIVGSASTPTGIITRISPAVDPASRTFEIEALADNPSQAVKPGAFAKGVIAAQAAAPVLALPMEALIRSGGGTYVYVVTDGKAHRRRVTTGRESEGRIEILSGLQAGEQAVLRGTEKLLEGAAVRVMSASAAKPD